MNQRGSGFTEWTGDDWKSFERLVAAYHQFLDNDYEVERDVKLTAPSGATAQVDVLLSRKAGYEEQILVSCKFEKRPVGPKHVREWITIVQDFAAAKGIVVSRAGFTKGAKDLAENPVHRIELWQMRPLSESDFEGAIQKVSITGILKVPFVPQDSVVFSVASTREEDTKEPIPFAFSKANRAHFYLRDEYDNVKENLWDEFVRTYYKHGEGEHVIRFNEPRYIIIENRRLLFQFFKFEIRYEYHRFPIEFDAMEHFSVMYENVITGKQQLVPTELIEFSERHSNDS